MIQIVQVNTRKKAETIIEALKKQGRFAIYEEFLHLYRQGVRHIL